MIACDAVLNASRKLRSISRSSVVEGITNFRVTDTDFERNPPATMQAITLK